jgi:hypothetical protein
VPPLLDAVQTQQFLFLQHFLTHQLQLLLEISTVRFQFLQEPTLFLGVVSSLSLSLGISLAATTFLLLFALFGAFLAGDFFAIELEVILKQFINLHPICLLFLLFEGQPVDELFLLSACSGRLLGLLLVERLPTIALALFMGFLQQLRDCVGDGVGFFGGDFFGGVKLSALVERQGLFDAGEG